MITLTLTEVAKLLAIALVPITNGPRGITNIPVPGELSIFGLTVISRFCNKWKIVKLDFITLLLLL